jgi:hypothetical protein
VGGVFTSISYDTNNGTTYTCASCSDCATAVDELDAFCQGSANPVTTCSTWSVCGTSSLDYEVCTTTLSGACQSMYYETSDSQTFQCNSCSDCSNAVTNMETYCGNQTTTTSCGAMMPCGSGTVTWDACTTSQGGTCQSITYASSDGLSSTLCNSCTDCSNAITAVDNYCASLTGVSCNGMTCATGDICCVCSGTYECLSSGGGVDTCTTFSCTDG